MRGKLDYLIRQDSGQTEVVGKFENILHYCDLLLRTLHFLGSRGALLSTRKMKRKLDQNEVPAGASDESTHKSFSKFQDLKLDPRLLRAITKEKFTKPTPVQAEAIPLALDGKDILGLKLLLSRNGRCANHFSARAKTGSGKTAAYVLPILQGLLRKRANSPSEKFISSLILVPTRELAEQVHKVFVAFASFCAKEVRSVNITQRVSDEVLRAVLADSPDIVIATPGRASQTLNSAILALEKLKYLVIDEADLVLSYGYEDELDAISKAIPRGYRHS